MNKKIIYPAIIVNSLFLASLAFGQTISAPSGVATTFPAILTGIARAVGELVAGVGAIMFFVAGVLYIFSAGNPGKLEKAKTALIYAIAGMVIGLSATAIVTWVQSVTS